MTHAHCLFSDIHVYLFHWILIVFGIRIFLAAPLYLVRLLFVRHQRGANERMNRERTVQNKNCRNRNEQAYHNARRDYDTRESIFLTDTRLARMPSAAGLLRGWEEVYYELWDLHDTFASCSLRRPTVVDKVRSADPSLWFCIADGKCYGPHASPQGAERRSRCIPQRTLVASVADLRGVCVD